MEGVRARTQASRDDEHDQLRQWKAMAEAAAASRRQQEEQAAAQRFRLEREAEARENRRLRGAPASDKAVLGLREPKPDEAAAAAAGQECAVCLEKFKEGDTLRMTPCSLCFHMRCVYGWLQASGVCPCCRIQMPSEDEQRVLDEPEAEALDQDQDGN